MLTSAPAHHEATKPTKSSWFNDLRALRASVKREACVVGLLSVALAGGVRAEIIDRVLAVVGGVVITQSDVTAAFALGLATAEPGDDPIAAVLSQLIDRQLILAEVDRYAPPEPATDAIDRMAEQVRARFPAQQAYNTALARSGIDEARLRHTLRDQLRLRAYLDQRFTVPPPNEGEIALYYRDHPQTFTRGGQVVPFDIARAAAAAALTTSRRTTLVNDWVSGLRRRADISNLYLIRR